MNIKLFAVASFSISLAAAAGCVVQPTTLGGGGAGGDSSGVGEGPGSGPGGPGSGPTGSTGSGSGESDARKFYVSSVHSLIVNSADAMHSCTVCHVSGASNAPMFMDSDAEKSYDKMVAYSGLVVAPTNSQLLLHGLHTGPALSQAQKDAVTHWLTMEAQAPSGTTTSTSSSSSGGGGPVMTLEEWLLQVGKCMEITDWQTNKLDLLAKAQTTSSGACNGCHSEGDGGNYLNQLDPTKTFTNQKMSPYVKRWFKPMYTGANVTGLLPNPRNSQKAVELSQSTCVQKPGVICHPTYTLDPVLKTGIDTFITTTLTRMANKQCAP